MHILQNPGGTAGRSEGLFKVALVAGAVFLLWRAGRELKGAAWSAFGLAWVAHWSGLWPW
jgi:hypothetical protein